MGVKQDRTYARTAQDLERKWKFGKSFAELLGLINDNRDKVDSVESSLRNEITEQSTTLKRDTEQIVMQATETVRTELNEGISGVNENISELSSKVEMKVDANSVNIAIESAMQEGVDRVYTKMGYSFDDEGINISKSGSEIANKLDHTGMYVKKSGNEVLTANANGVKATDLHANTYLIIGKGNGRSRFEDYGINRTACFWIGG
jgi:hypothetical protein